MTKGLWLGQTIGNPSVPNTMPVFGNRILIKWGSVQPTPTTFDWPYFDKQIMYCVNRGISICLEIEVAGPFVAQPFTPSWIYDQGVPRVEIIDSDNVYPYYFNPIYNAYLLSMLSAVRLHMTEYDANIKQYLYSWFLVFGSTGDVVPYQGIPEDENYYITDTQWSDYLKAKYISQNALILSLFPNMRTMINQGNDNSYFQWALDNLINPDFKTGDFSHTWGQPGDKNYAAIMQALPEDVLCQAEAANPLWLTAEWNVSKTRCTFTLCASALTANMRVLNIASALYTANGGLLYAFNFLNLYANVTPTSSIGFCYLSDRIDLADTERFPEDGYLPVIDPARLGAYTAAYNAIIAGGYPAAEQSYLITRIVCTYFNPARIAIIRAEFPNANYIEVDRSRDGDAYMNDYNINSMPGNYGVNVTQYNPNQGGYGVYRVGGVTNNTGRYGKQIDSGRPEMFFSFGQNMTSTGNNKTIYVTYIDNGTGIWSLNCMTERGQAEIKVNQNKNTGEEIRLQVNITGMLLGGLLDNGTDLLIKYLNGDAPIFTLIEISI